jgi:NADH-quinone oxidoreductase subunit J
LINISIISFFYNAKFLALLFIIIYVGAVLVLFLFTIMLLGYKQDQKIEKKNFLFTLFIFFFLAYIYLQMKNLNGFFIETNLLNNFNLRYNNIQKFDNNIYIYHLTFLENLEKIGYYIFIESPKIIFLSTIILLTGMIASINISKLNNILLKNQQKELQIKRKVIKSINLFDKK